MKITSLLFVTIAAGSLALAAATQEATYVVGSLDEIAPGAAGVLHLDGDRLTFHSGKVTMETSYSKITGTELGPKLIHGADAPQHKAWSLHKHYSEKTVFQNLIVNFTDASGKAQTMTFEMTENGAGEIFGTLELRTGQRARRQQQEGWWGDDVWRTNRNGKDWDQSTAIAKQ